MEKIRKSTSRMCGTVKAKSEAKTPLNRLGFEVSRSPSSLTDKRPRPTIAINTHAKTVIAKKLADGKTPSNERRRWLFL
tara:strand:- start:104 stop:340 length:237 start_codon:yes stop_codon:yes gene_type:complete